MISAIFQEVFFRPILNLLVIIYNAIPGKDLGVAVILVVILIRILLAPLFKKSIMTQMKMQNLQPELQEIRRKFKGDKEGETRATLQLYRDHKLNPFSGFLIILAQLPIMIALYRVFLKGLQQDGISQYLYGFVPNPGHMNTIFLGFMDLTKPAWYLAVIAAVAQFFQTVMITPGLSGDIHSKHSAETLVARQMLYIGPLFTVLILWSLPAVIAIYWIVTTVFALWQQYRISREISAKK